MAEIVEVFEDFGNNTKKLFKNKKFLLAAGGVGVVALIAGYLKNRDSDEDTTAYEAIGYAGYPTVGGGTSADSVDSLTGDSYETTFDALFSNISDLSDKLMKLEEDNNSMMEQMQKQNDIAQMKANSELYNALGAPEYAGVRESLKAENQQIAEKYGFTFDEGNWFDGNSLVYMPSSQQASVIKKTGLTGSDDTFVNNANYVAARVGSVSGTQEFESDRVSTKIVTATGGTTLYTKDKETGDSAIYRIASDGKVIEYNDGVTSKKTVSSELTPDGTKRITVKPSVKQPSMARDTSRAGTTIETGGWAITYNDDGYAVKRVRV